MRERVNVSLMNRCEGEWGDCVVEEGGGGALWEVVALSGQAEV